MEGVENDDLVRRFHCTRCTRAFARLEHLQRHERSRECQLPVATLGRLIGLGRHEGEAIPMFCVSQGIHPKVHTKPSTGVILKR